MHISLQQTGFTSSACYHALLWSLTPLLSPLPSKLGGFVSVALSLGLPPAAVSGCYVLRCPDFPLAPKGERLSN